MASTRCCNGILSMDRQEWLNQLKIGDRVNFSRAGRDTREMIIRTADDDRICLVDAARPKSDLALGEVVWREYGEGPFGERIDIVSDEHV